MKATTALYAASATVGLALWLTGTQAPVIAGQTGGRRSHRC